MNENQEQKCGCYACHDARGEISTHMIICSKCGNKRCPHATDHNNECTGSNAVGQKGSNYQ